MNFETKLIFLPFVSNFELKSSRMSASPTSSGLFRWNWVRIRCNLLVTSQFGQNWASFGENLGEVWAEVAWMRQKLLVCFKKLQKHWKFWENSLKMAKLRAISHNFWNILGKFGEIKGNRVKSRRIDTETKVDFENFVKHSLSVGRMCHFSFTLVDFLWFFFNLLPCVCPNCNRSFTKVNKIP